MRRLLPLLLLLAFLITPVLSALNTSGPISTFLSPNSTNSLSFNLSTNTTENVSLSEGNSYLIYDWNRNITNNSYRNFTFIIPRSSNLTANLSWTNSTNNLTLTLTNLRTGISYPNNSGNTPSVLDLNSSQVTYGIWKASVYGENVSGIENFNLTIKLLDKRFTTNFTKITHSFNETIENNSAVNWSFYVDNTSVNSIDISLSSNATNDINLSLYNSTNLLDSNLINSNLTENGFASFSISTNLTKGYWSVLINNTNTSANFSYSLNITLQGNNITKLGNLTNQSTTFVNFNITAPEMNLTEGNYTLPIKVSATSGVNEMNININLSTPILKITPDWKGNNYIGDQKLFASTTESYNTTRNLYVNINQSKTFNFLINNTGSLNLTGLTQTNSTNFTNGNLSLNITNITLPENISAGGTGYLNITIDTPNSSYINNSLSGWVFISSSNGQPLNYINLTLNITVKDQLLARLNKSVYYFENPSIGLKTYYFGNQTLDKRWDNSVNYTLNITNSTNNSQVFKQINFTFNNSLNYLTGTLNTTNLREGNYTLLGEINDSANNTAEVNLTFELLHNLNITPLVSPSNIVGGHNFTLTANISKLGSVEARNVTVCIYLPEGINLSSNPSKRIDCQNLTANITNSTSEQKNWTLIADAKYVSDPYTINITGYSKDGRFNKTEQKNVTVKYGLLTVSLNDDTPSSAEVNDTFTVKVNVKNIGNWNASNVDVDIKVDGTTKDTGCNSKEIGVGKTITCSADFSFSSAGTRDISVELSAINATYDSSSDVGSVDITSPSSNDGTNGGGNNQTNYDITFLKPTEDSISIAQGEDRKLEIKVENSGTGRLNECYLNITGIDSKIFVIGPEDKSDLDVGKERSFDVVFSIPEDFEAKTYDLKLKFICEEDSETKDLELEILNTNLTFLNITDLEVVQGQSITKTLEFKNNGDVELRNITLSLSGLDKEYYNLSPKKVNLLSKSEEFSAELNISTPESMEIGRKNLTIVVDSDKKTFERTFVLTVRPSEKTKQNISAQYNELLSKYENLTKVLEKAKSQGRNVSSLEQELKTLNNSLTKIKNYLDQGKYIEAKNELESASSTFATLSTELQEKEPQKEEGPILLIVVIALVIVLLGVILAYTYIIPKKRADIRKTYKYKGGTFDNLKNTINSLLNSLTKKLSRRKSQDEVLRERKLREWRKYYDELKKKKYGK